MATGTRRTTSKKRTTKKKRQQEAAFRNEVILWIVLAVSIIIFLANFGVGGFVGEKISAFIFGLFGLTAYVFPICLFVGTAFAMSNKENGVATIKLVAGILFVAFLCLFVQMVSDTDKAQNAVEAFKSSMETKGGGGIVGGLLESLLCPAFGVIGTYVIDIIVLIIALVLITERSFFRGMQKGGKKLYDTARDDAARRKEIQSKRRDLREQEREQRRMDKHVSGVAMNTKLEKPSKKKSEAEPAGLSELKPEPELVTPKVQEEEHIRLTSDETASAETAPASGNVFEDFHKLFEQPQETIELPEMPAAEPEHTAPLETDISSEDFIPVNAESPLTEVSEADADPVTDPEPEPKKHRSTRSSKEEVEQEIADVAMTVQAQEQMQGEAKQTYIFPPVSLLKAGDKNAAGDTQAHLRATAAKLQQTLKTFGVNVTITNVSCGPAVTRYEIQPEMGVKVSKIVGLSDDIKLNLAAADIRMEAPIPGKAAIGIEVPNKESVAVMFRDLVESEEFKKHPSPIAFAAGKDIGGKVIVTDIAKMPHLLIAGATGSGKSVCINTIIMSILYRAHPDDVKLIMIDPKVVELSVYNGIPHLFIPVVTDPKKAAGALHWAVSEMTDRYNKFAEFGVRDLKGYNQKVESIADIDDPDKPKKMPQIVIIVDELADLMMVAPGDVEDAICRLAQLARAAGIHLIIATQRPSVNVITGLIKANMPSRIAFSVTSGVDSRTILDMNGAEKLLGKGDMLFYPQGMQKPLRVQGAFVSHKEVADVVDFVKNQNGEVSYNNEIEEKMSSISTSSGGSDSSGAPGDDRDVYFADAAKLLIDKDKGSIGMLQRYFKIGFNRAARIMDQLEEAGVVGPDEGTKPRQVLMSPEQLEVYIDENC